MKEFIEKLIERLEDEKSNVPVNRILDDIINDKPKELGQLMAYSKAIKIARELAEEYNAGWIEKLLEAKKNCSEDSDCSECPFSQIEDRCILAELQIRGGNNGWIPCSEKLPRDGISVIVSYKDRFLSQADDTCEGWYDSSNMMWHLTDYKYSNNAEVIAWRKKLEPYQPKGDNNG